MKTVSVYVDPEVQGVLNIFDGLLGRYDENYSIPAHLEQLAQRLLAAYESKSFDIKFIVGQRLHDLGMDHIFSSAFNIDLARQCIAQEHGYHSWDVVLSDNHVIDSVFESLVDKMLAGDIDAIQRAVKGNPDIIHQTSVFPHQATLLHYTGSNGVEAYRQIVPINLAEIVAFLLEVGADNKRKANIYGGCIARELLETSKHSYESGVIVDVQAVYEAFAGDQV